MIRAIGLMSGTSMDGVDVALIETDGEAAVTAGATSFLPYSEEDRHLLRAALADAVHLADRQARPETLAAAEAMITKRHIEAVETFLAAEKIDRQSIEVAGFHGQTVLHRPERKLTVQIGDGAALALMISGRRMSKRAGRARRWCQFITVLWPRRRVLPARPPLLILAASRI